MTLAMHPIDFAKIAKNKKNLDREMLRLAIIAELDAISLYEQISEATDIEDIKKVMLDVAREEKTHVGEFHAMLLRFDDEQAREIEEGATEVEELTRV